MNTEYLTIISNLNNRYNINLKQKYFIIFKIKQINNIVSVNLQNFKNDT